MVCRVQREQIGRITTAGLFTEYTVPTASAGPFVIESGSAGLLWFTERNAGKLASITTGGRITEYAVPGPSDIEPSGIAPSGSPIWGTEFNANKIVSLTP